MSEIILEREEDADERADEMRDLLDAEDDEDVCEHGVGFDEVCEDCEEEADGETERQICQQG